MLYTSGTTGFPKGAMHSQRSFVTGGEAFVQRVYLQDDDRVMVVLPMFHINANFYSLAGTALERDQCARLVEAADRGVGVLLISEDLEEVLAISDRVLVLFEGRIVHETTAADASREAIGLAMAGVAP